MPATASPEAALRRIDYGRLQAATDLFRAYCTDYEAVAGFYAGDPFDPGARRAAADRAARHERDRAALAAVLREQHAAWGLDDDRARRHIDRLERPEAVAVVTGQQVGLFTGPLYTLYKALTTLRLVRRLEEETGRPVVPVFWVEGEDHDFDEIATVGLLRRNEPMALRYRGTGADADNPGAVGRLTLTDAVTDLVDAVDETLPPSDFKPALMEAVRAAYRPGARIEDAFVHFLHHLLPEAGLVFMNPDDARLKQLVAPLFRREIEDPSATAARVEERSERLRARFHAQVHVRPTNLFLLDEHGRLPLDAEGEDRFTLRGTGRSLARAEVLDLLDDAPERFSPNVVLRPLMQDALLPTAAYVAGPGEIAYFAQYGSVYEWAGLPMPVLYPRASITLVEGKVQKVLDRYDLDVADVDEDADRLFDRVVRGRMTVDVDAVFREATTPVHQAVNELKAQVEQVDATLVKTAEATRAALVKELESFKSRVVRAEKRHHDEVRAQLDKAHANLFPEGTPQERFVSPLYYLNKYGPDLVERLARDLSLDTRAHQVIQV